jgi:hypothetical protein
MVISEPGTKMLAIAIYDTTYTILPAGSTRIISHNFFFFLNDLYIHTMHQV